MARAQQLVKAGEPVIDVPTTLSARVRLLSGGSARKTDSHDARSTAIAALHGRRLRHVTVEDTTMVLRLLSDRRDQLSHERNWIVCRMHTCSVIYVPVVSRRARPPTKPAGS